VESLALALETSESSDLALTAALRAIRTGQSYDDILSALVLASVRQIRPRPSLGPMFHAVMMMHAVDSAARRSAGEDRWRSVLWAVDVFKEQQERYRKEGGVPFGPPPRPSRAATSTALLGQALEAWDEEAADAAISSLHEHEDEARIFEVLFRYGARDYRDIGHKSIFVAGARRLLKRMDFRRARPLLRSVVLGLLRHSGPTPPKDPKLDATWARNQELVARIVPQGDAPSAKPEVTRELLGVFRTASDADACQAVIQSLNRGDGAQSVWDAIACGAAELVLNRPDSLLALHAVTTTDALAFAWQTAAAAETRRLILLHATGRLVAFRDYAAENDGPSATRLAIDGFAPLTDAVDIPSIFAAPGSTASLLSLGYLERSAGADQILYAMHAIVLARADGPHDYKFNQAVVEQLGWISPPWRSRFLAASLAHALRPHAAASSRAEKVNALVAGENR
jgi:hypothetical protein